MLNIDGIWLFFLLVLTVLWKTNAANVPQNQPFGSWFLSAVSFLDSSLIMFLLIQLFLHLISQILLFLDAVASVCYLIAWILRPYLQHKSHLEVGTSMNVTTPGSVQFIHPMYELWILTPLIEECEGGQPRPDTLKDTGHRWQWSNTSLAVKGFSHISFLLCLISLIFFSCPFSQSSVQHSHQFHWLCSFDSIWLQLVLDVFMSLSCLLLLLFSILLHLLILLVNRWNLGDNTQNNKMECINGHTQTMWDRTRGMGDSLEFGIIGKTVLVGPSIPSFPWANINDTSTNWTLQLTK